MLPPFCLKGRQIMDLKMLKGMKLEDLLNVDYTKLNEQEIQYVEKRLIKTVNRRISKLKQSGQLTSSRLSTKERKGMSGYKPPKNRVKVTRGGKKITINVRNKLVSSANKARKTLLKTTSTVKGVTEAEERYRKMISEKLGKDLKIDKRRLKRINRLMKKAEELIDMGGTNKKFSGSPIVLQTIVDIVKSRDYITNDKAEQIIMESIDNGYQAGQRMLKQLLDEDSEGTSIDFPIDE